MFKKNDNLLVALLLASITMLPAISRAAGFQINENSPRLQGQAMAGSGSDAGDVSACFNNPALAGTIKTPEIYAGMSYIAPHVKMNNAQAEHGTFVSPMTPVSGSASQRNIAKSAFVPNVYFASPLNENLSFGFAITAPWGLTTNYHNDSVVRFMAQKTALQAVNLTPSLAYHISDKLILGAGLQVQNVSAEFSNFDGSVPLNPPSSFDVATFVPSDLKASGWAYGYTLGLLFSPDATTNIGLSYHSQLNYSLRGHGRQEMVRKNQHIDPTSLYNSDVSTRGNFNTPAVVNLSVSHKLNSRWTVNSLAQITFWNSLSSLTINTPEGFAKSTTLELNWNNSFLYSLGTDYKLNKHWTLRSGVAADETPTNDTNRDARIPDSNRY
jgi:long-chain fatty acid transport protein